MVCTLGSDLATMQDCCDAGFIAACPNWTYNEFTGSCSVTPYNSDASLASFQYGRTEDDCCKAYTIQDDDDMLKACSETTVDPLCMLEVYESNSMVCDTVTSERTVYLTSAGEVGGITYSAPHTDSTPLRCCLSSSDFYENPNACIE